MAGRKRKFESIEDRQINIHEKFEVEYRTKQYGCTKKQLLDAIKVVGTMASEVENYLKSGLEEQIDSSSDKPGVS